MTKHGTFIISLDFELFWGIFDKADISKRIHYFDNTLAVIPDVLKLFESYNIQATWASVGFLFFNDMTDLKKHLPDRIPHYTNKKLSAYHYINTLYDDKYEKYHFAPDLIRQILQTNGQEIGSHTLSHYYCLAEGQNIEDFEADLKQHVAVAKRFGIKLKSLVFPRNQYNQAYEAVLLKYSVEYIRTNPDVWFWDTTKKETLLTKIFRTADAYIPLHNNLFTLENTDYNKSQIIKIPASRFFRPLSPYKILNKIRLNRIKNEMTRAAKQKKIYHLWWHPHNFGQNPEKSLKELTELLQHYHVLHKKYRFRSRKMSNLL